MNRETQLQFRFASAVLFDPTVARGYMKHHVPIPGDVAAELETAAVKHLEGQLDGR